MKEKINYKNEEAFEKYFNVEKIEEFKNINNIEGKHIKHPILYLMQNPKMNVTYNTKFSFDYLNSINSDYLNKMIKKIEKEKNFSNINGLLGEIRTYAYLLDSFMNSNITINSVNTKKNIQTSDFEVINEKNKEKVYVEVNTKQCNDDESKKLQKYREDLEKKLCEETLNRTNNKPKINISTVSFAPFGRGKGKNDVNMKVIQKIAQTKQSKNQIPKKECGILWMDFQSEDINGVLDLKQSEPLWYIKNYGMFSGLIWYALYGKKNLPIFNSNQFDDAYKGYEKLHIMEHPGLFIQRKDISAVIISEGKYTLFFENPYSNKKIPMWFLKKIINVRNFNYEHSKIPFPRYSVKKRVKNDYIKIQKLSKMPNISF